MPSVRLLSGFRLSSLTNVLKALSMSVGILLGPFALQVAPALRVEIPSELPALAIKRKLATT